MNGQESSKHKKSILTLTDYDSNAVSFDRFRRPGKNTLARLRSLLGGMRGHEPVLSVGCGTGQYEHELFPGSGRVVGLDMSEGMLSIAEGRIKNRVRGDMSALPFGDKSFSGVFFIQSLHHMGASFSLTQDAREDARRHVLKEAVRVLKKGPVAIVQRDPSQNEAVWFWRYFPGALKNKLIIQPKVRQVAAWLKELGLSDVRFEPVKDPMIRDFYRPEAPLDPLFRRSFSDFTYLSPDEMEKGCRELKEAISSGRVEQDIAECKKRFEEIGGNLFVISAEKKEV